MVRRFGAEEMIHKKRSLFLHTYIGIFRDDEIRLERIEVHADPGGEAGSEILGAIDDTPGSTSSNKRKVFGTEDVMVARGELHSCFEAFRGPEREQ